MAFMPWLDDETEDVGMPVEGPQDAEGTPMPKAQIDPAVRQSVMDKYNMAASSQGVDDAREKAKYMKAGAGVMDNLGALVGGPTTVVYKNGWGDASAPKTQAFGGVKTSGDAFRDAAKTGVDEAKEDRASKIAGFEQENKLNNQERQQGREDVQDGYHAEEMGQKRTDWEQKGKDQGRKDAINGREDDPNSPESQMARDIVKQMGSKVNVDGMSATQLKAQSPTLEQLYKIQQERLNHQDMLAGKQADRDLLLGQKKDAAAEKSVEKARLSDNQLKDVTNFDEGLDLIGSIKSQRKTQATGTMHNATESAKDMVGQGDPKYLAFKAQVQDNLAQYIKNMSGATVSAQERVSLMQSMPTMNDSPAVFDAKIEVLDKKLKANRTTYLGNLGKNGRNTDPYARPEATPEDSATQLSPADQKAVDWAKANPKDPRAAQILQLHGM